MPENKNQTPPSIIFIFGGSGDLNQRKLTPALYNLFIDEWMPEDFEIIGIGRSVYSNDKFRAHLFEGIQQFSRRKDENKWQEFSERISYIQMDAENQEAYNKITDCIKQLKDKWGNHPNIIFYLAVAPQLVPDIAKKLGSMDLCSDELHTRIVVEKPFGHDLKSAESLNKLLTGMFCRRPDLPH